MPKALDSWNPGQYNLFEQERLLPFYELLRLIEPRPGIRVIDLGCGTGKTTQILHHLLQASSTLGIDSSDSMLREAGNLHDPGLELKSGLIEEFHDASSYDLVFSNSALHWVHHHEQLLPRLYGALRPGGQLAIQLPVNQQHPTHVIAEKLACEDPYRLDSVFADFPLQSVLSLEQYALAISSFRPARQYVSCRLFVHELPGPEYAFEWVRGSLLAGYRQALGDRLFEGFEAEYKYRLLKALPKDRPYRLIYRRIFLWARKPD